MSNNRSNLAREDVADYGFAKTNHLSGGLPREEAIARAEEAVARMAPETDKVIHSQLALLNEALAKARSRDVRYKDHIKAAHEAGIKIRDVADRNTHSVVSFITTLLCQIIDTSDEVGMPYPTDVIECFADALLLTQSAEHQGQKLDDLAELATALKKTASIVEGMAARLQK